MVESTLERKIKKNIYGKAQIAQVIFPPGFADICHNETQQILKNLWFPQKFTSQIHLLPSEIRIENIHLSALTELLMRSECATDIRLVIFAGKTVGTQVFEKKCRAIHWDMYINQNMSLRIKVDSIASKAFHESGLKEILSNIVKEYGCTIQSGETTDETTSIYVHLYKDKLTISISLAGQPLYKRGFRETLSKSAPLREDLAACCLQKAFAFAKQIDPKFTPDTMIIPFSGTGTFAFEYLISRYQFYPVLFDRAYAIQSMPLYRESSYHFLLKKAKEHCLFAKEYPPKNSILCIDNSSNANHALLDNLNNFQDAITKNGFVLEDVVSLQQDNFINMATWAIEKNVFIPMNPPYGIRIGKTNDAVTLYKNIAKKINEFSQKTEKHLLGFILCPNQATWSAFYKTLKSHESETYHFTQGGMDIRVCQFFI